MTWGKGVKHTSLNFFACKTYFFPKCLLWVLLALFSTPPQLSQHPAGTLWPVFLLLHCIFILDCTQNQRGIEVTPKGLCQIQAEHIITWPYQSVLYNKAPSIICLQAAQSPGAWLTRRSDLSRMRGFLSYMQWYDQVP